MSIIVEAEIQFIPTEKGGRTSILKTDRAYRPNHIFEYTDEKLQTTFIGEITFINCKEIKPGETVLAQVDFMKTPLLIDHLHIGKQWYIHEGKNLVAIGTVLNFSF